MMQIDPQLIHNANIRIQNLTLRIEKSPSCSNETTCSCPLHVERERLSTAISDITRADGTLVKEIERITGELETVNEVEW